MYKNPLRTNLYLPILAIDIRHSMLMLKFYIVQVVSHFGAIYC